MVDYSVSVRFKKLAAQKKKLPLNIRIQWNAGTACVSKCVLKKLACRGLRVGPSKSQGALKERNLLGQSEPKRRCLLVFAGSRHSLGSKAFGKLRFSQNTADSCRKPQKTAGTRRKPQIGVCPLSRWSQDKATPWKRAQENF